jgi:hypothetical protein
VDAESATTPESSMTCRCHSGLLYASLRDCPACGHHSLDILKTWAGCERKACGWQTESRRSYRNLMAWPAWGLYASDSLIATIRAESAHAARVLFIGAGLQGDRVRRVDGCQQPPSTRRAA